MTLHELPTVWNVYGLRGSPYFQEALQTTHERRTLDLFIGRTAELADLRTFMHGRDSSRQAVTGVSGVGKTTLVQRLKADALADGYLTTDSLVPFLAGDTPEALFGRVLSGVYDTILANRPMAGGGDAMQAAQQMVRAARLPTGGGNVTVLGVGGGVTKGVTVVTPKDVLIDGPRVLRDLLALVRQSDARGLVLHLNNLENLSSADLDGAAELLLSLRDPMLMLDGLHVVLVGTTEAVHQVLNAHAQVRNVFKAPLVLGPLDVDEVHALLRARYDRWRMPGDQPPRSPVDDLVVDRLFDVFRGDLRGLLKALDDGVEECIGLGAPADLPASVPGRARGVPPVGLPELSRALQARYDAVMRSELEDARVIQLERWAATDPMQARTQSDLATLWQLTQGTVSTALAALEGAGYVITHPRRGKSAIQYSLAGKARLATGTV